MSMLAEKKIMRRILLSKRKTSLQVYFSKREGPEPVARVEPISKLRLWRNSNRSLLLEKPFAKKISLSLRSRRKFFSFG